MFDHGNYKRVSSSASRVLLKGSKTKYLRGYTDRRRDADLAIFLFSAVADGDEDEDEEEDGDNEADTRH